MKKIINLKEPKSIINKEKIKKFFYFLGIHVFSIILIFIFIDLLIGGWLFYKYVILANQQELDAQVDSFKFDENAYQNVLIELEERDKIFNDSSPKNYANPF